SASSSSLSGSCGSSPSVTSSASSSATSSVTSSGFSSSSTVPTSSSSSPEFISLTIDCSESSSNSDANTSRLLVVSNPRDKDKASIVDVFFFIMYNSPFSK